MDEKETDQIKILDPYRCAYLKAFSAYSSRIKFVGSSQVNSPYNNSKLLAYVFSPTEEVIAVLDELELEDKHPSFSDVFYQHQQFFKKAQELKKGGPK